MTALARCLAALLLFTAAFLPLRADDANAGPAPVTNPAQVAAHYRQVLARPEFQELPDTDVNDRMKTWLSEWFTRLGQKFEQFKYTQEMPRFASMLMTVFVAAALVGLLYVLVRLTHRRRARDSFGGPEAPATRRLQPPEFYEEELRGARAAGDWHAAWLASWRQFLSRLEQARLVAADRSRTNREYLAQLRAQPQAPSTLALLTAMVNAYDRYIYGQRAIGEPDWLSFQGQLDEAGLLLHLTDHPSAPHES